MIGGSNPFASEYLPREWLGQLTGFQCQDLPCMQHPPKFGDFDATELFADLFLNWVLDLRPEYSNNGFNYKDKNGMGMSFSTWMDSTNPNYQDVGMSYFLIYDMDIQVVPYHTY